MLNNVLTDLLARTANWHVIFIQHNANLIHQPDLFFIIAFQVIIAACSVPRGANQGCVDLGKKTQDILGRDCAGLSRSHSGTHDCDCDFDYDSVRTR